MARKKKKSPLSPELDDLILPIAEKFLREGASTEKVAEWVRKTLQKRNASVGFTREQVYPAVREAIRLKYVSFTPPLDATMARDIAHGTGVPEKNVTVTNVQSMTPARSVEHLAGVAARTAVKLLAARAKGKPRDGDGKRYVHLGLGAGRTTQLVAKALGERLAAENPFPVGTEIVLHAITSGFIVTNPDSSPVSFFSFFSDAIVPVSYVALYSHPMVPCGQFKELKQQAGIRESFRRAREIEMVITSLAQANDDSALLNKFEKAYGMNETQRRERVGDVQYRPFSATGPIQDDPLDPDANRAVTLFELEDYCRMVQKEGKHLLLISGPNEAGETRTAALLPLLTQKSLRVWSHLCLDYSTAASVVPALPTPASP